jgi:hypothetical protein
MAPLRDWRPKGERVRSFTPHGHRRTLTFLGASRCDAAAASPHLACSTASSTANACEHMWRRS